MIFFLKPFALLVLRRMSASSSSVSSPFEPLATSLNDGVELHAHGDSRIGRLSLILTLTSVFFFVELVVGYVANSTALLADSFHMLSDVAALLVGIYAIKAARKPAGATNTYGWVRAEVFGALVNGVALLALCFTISIDALKRVFEPEPVRHPVILLVVGGIGLAINIIGLAVLSGGGGHGHSHGGGEASGDLNMRGVVLHVFTDMLGSIAVIASALVVWLAKGRWRFYVDPALTLVIVGLIVRSTFPIVRDSARVLLQGIPSTLSLDNLAASLRNVPNVESVHELHVWQLAERTPVASCHIKQANQSLELSLQLLQAIKAVFHLHGIHSTTVQLEYPGARESSSACAVVCTPFTADCSAHACCPSNVVLRRA